MSFSYEIDYLNVKFVLEGRAGRGLRLPAQGREKIGNEQN